MKDTLCLISKHWFRQIWSFRLSIISLLAISVAEPKVVQKEDKLSGRITNNVIACPNCTHSTSREICSCWESLVFHTFSQVKSLCCVEPSRNIDPILSGTNFKSRTSKLPKHDFPVFFPNYDFSRTTSDSLNQLFDFLFSKNYAFPYTVCLIGVV